MADAEAAAAVILYRIHPHLEVFWMRRAAHVSFEAGYHAFPGGKCDPGEGIRECAARELKEETGVAIDPRSLLFFGRWLTPPLMPRRFDASFFLAKCRDGQDPAAVNEHDFGEWTRPADALRLWYQAGILITAPVLVALRRLSDGLESIEVPMKDEQDVDPEGEVEASPGIVLVPVIHLRIWNEPSLKDWLPPRSPNCRTSFARSFETLP